mmetsp:Transcript_37189/g.51349  ORF Transcript_37189/g.51349 Transcript_37189/m.51349 type:complete len:97 (+) Transcript_37189:381-671(+)
MAKNVVVGWELSVEEVDVLEHNHHEETPSCAAVVVVNERAEVAFPLGKAVAFFLYALGLVDGVVVVVERVGDVGVVVGVGVVDVGSLEREGIGEVD